MLPIAAVASLDLRRPQLGVCRRSGIQVEKEVVSTRPGERYDPRSRNQPPAAKEILLPSMT